MTPSSASKLPALKTDADDYALMSALSAHDSTALSALYDRYNGVVYSLCLRSLRDAGEAEDLLVEIFWELWDRAGRFDASRGRPLAHILGLARSRAIDRLRSRRGRMKGHSESNTDVIASQPRSTAPSPPQSIILDEQRQRLARAMDALPPDQRVALELAFYDGMSHSEVADKLGQPLGTIKSRIRHALMHVRRLIGGEDEAVETQR